MHAHKAQPAAPEHHLSRLILKDVQLWRGDTIVLQDINWHVQPAEHWAILGANGSGKTSLIMAISGYLPFSRGKIFLIDGWIGKINLPEQRKRIGIVSQSLTDYIAKNIPQITALELILSGLFGSLRLVDEVTEEQRQRARQILAELGHVELAMKPLSLLSTGERQTCMLGRSKMARSELVLLDEPCAGLDLGARERFLASVEAMIDSAHAPTLVFVTHHPEEIVSGISHVLLMRDGAVVAAGPKAEVMTSTLLSQTFDFPLRVMADNGRYWVQASHS
jgi:iron complex transport system ATP-binding protein